MTQIEIPREMSPPRPAPGPSTGRLVGVDLARALAVFGMFAVHVGPGEDVGGVGGRLLSLTEGRSSILFATLAGFSLMLIAGRREPKTGLAGRQAKVRIAIRALILLALGTVLTMLGTGIAVILAFYGVYFLLALPLVRLPAKTLAIIAAGLAVAAPQAAFGLKRVLSASVEESVNAYDPIARLGGDGLLSLLLDGNYPAITWMPFVIAGMALGRLDLAAVAVQRRLALLGPALIALGYGTSWLAFRLITPLREAMAKSFPKSFDPGSMDLDTLLSGAKAELESNPPAAFLMTAGPHSGTTFEIIGGVGVAITVLVCATVAMARLGWLRRPASPLVAVGSMSLTLYVAHVAAYALLPEDSTEAFVPLLGFIAGAIVFAVVWSRFFRRGPLEYLLNRATKPARFVR